MARESKEGRKMSSITELAERLREKGIRTVEAGFGDLQGTLRGKRFPLREIHRLDREGFAVCNGALCWDIQCVVFPVGYASFDTGYPDLQARPVWETLRPSTWDDRTAFVLCDVLDGDGTPLPESPREVLKGVLRHADRLGFAPQVGTELEFYLLGEDRKPLYPGIQAYSLGKGSALEFVVGEIRERLEGFGIDVEASNAEYGPAQVEINLAYGPALEIADRTVLFKHIVKETARGHGLIASFMPKIWASESGSGFHVHQSLWDRDRGSNLFESDRGLAERYLAGQLATLREFAAFGAPSINAYKRVQDDSFAPVNATWGGDNRTVAVRAILDAGKASRLELRTGAADANPYLAVAAAIAGGLHGIERGLPLETPPQSGNAYQAPATRLPENLHEALVELAAGSVAPDYFSRRFLDHYLAVGRHEWSLHLKSVTDWERDRYLENS